MKSEIYGLWQHKDLLLPCGMNIKDKLWWRFMPGVVINVQWPKGLVRVGPSHRDGWSGYGEYLSLPVDQVQVMATLGDPKATLLLPAIRVLSIESTAARMIKQHFGVEE